MRQAQKTSQIRGNPGGLVGQILTFVQGHWVMLVLGLILLIAVALRYANLMQVRHNIDHAYPIWQAMRTLDTGELPLVGQKSSVLFANPALTGYLYLPVVALFRSPVAVYVMVVALNSLAVWFGYRAALTLTRKQSLALIAAFLMAVNPWVVEYSRTTWVQSLLPFFVCGTAWLLWPVLLEQAKHPTRRFIAAMVMMTLLTQTYLLAFAIMLPVAIMVVIFRKNIPLRGVVIGALIFGLASGLYALGLLTQDQAVTDTVGEFAAQPYQFTGEAMSHALRLVTGDGYAQTRGTTLADAPTRQSLESIAHIVMSALLLIGVGRAVWSIYRRRPDAAAAIIALVWYIVPVLAMTYTGSPVHPFYQILGIPAGYILLAWGVGPLLNVRWGAVAIGGALLAFALLMGINGLRFAQETALRPGLDRFQGLPLDEGLAIGEAINTHLDEGAVVFSTENPWTLHSFSGTIFPVIADTRTPEVTILPASGALYLAFAVPDRTNMQPPLYEPVAAQTLNDGVQWDLFRFPGGAVDLNDVPVQVDIPTQQGLTLCCYQLRQSRRVDERWTLTTYWRVEAANPATSRDSFGPFLHVYNDDGEQIANIGGEMIPGFNWRAGDVHVHRQRFDLPEAGPFSIRLGQFDPFNETNMIFLPPDGEARARFAIPGVDSTR